MGISRETDDIFANTFGSLRQHVNPQLWASPSLVTFGRQSTEGLGKSPEEYFKGFGFDQVDSLDVSDFEGCSIVHDLNDPVPVQYHQKYHCVFDGGTMEHVFDIKSALFNAHNLLRAGGVVVHANPVNNQTNHGFYQFSPTLLLGFYGQNGYRIVRLILTSRIKGGPIQKVLDIGESQALSLALAQRIVFPLSFTSDYLTSMLFVAVKPEVHRDPVVPQQPFYADRFADQQFKKYKRILML